MRSWPGLALSVAMLFGMGCASVSTRAACPAEGGHAWHEVQSAHFRVKTNLDPEVARKVTLDLERFRRALLSVWTRSFDPPGQLEAIVLRSRGQLAEFHSEKSLGFARFTPNGPLIVMDGGGAMLFEPDVDQNVHAHELAHYLSFYVMARQPRWYAEGLASYLETAYLRQGGKEAVLGRPKSEVLRYARERSTWLTLDELWRWEQEAIPLEDQGMHYISSWLWVAYLMNEHGPRFTDFQLRLSRAEEPRKAFEAAFAGAGDLEAGLHFYLERGSFAMWAVPVDGVPTETQVRALEGAEVHAIRARLFLLARGKGAEEQKKAAQLEVAQALKENPTNVSAVQLQSAFLDKAAERMALAEALVKSRPDSGLAWGLLAEAHREAGSPAAAQEQALVRAAELSPDDASVHNNLAWLYVQSKAPQKAYELAVRAVKLAPYSAAYVDTYAAVLFELGQCPKSLNAQRRAIELLHERVADAVRQDFQSRLTRYETVCRERAAAPGPLDALEKKR